MTKIPFTDEKSKTPKPKTLRENSTRRLLHGLVNQLSVINLLTFKLRSRCGRGESSLDSEILRSIETAVAQAGEYAEAFEALNERLAGETPGRSPNRKKSRLVRAAHLTIVRVRGGSN